MIILSTLLLGLLLCVRDVINARDAKKEKDLMSIHDVQHDGRIGAYQKMEKKVQNNYEDKWNIKSIIKI